MTAALASLGVGMLQFRFPPSPPDERRHRRSILAGVPASSLGAHAHESGLAVADAGSSRGSAFGLSAAQLAEAQLEYQLDGTAAAARRSLKAGANLWPSATYDSARAICRTQAGNGWLPTLTVAHIPGIIAMLEVMRPRQPARLHARLHDLPVETCSLPCGCACTQRVRGKRSLRPPPFE